MKVYRKALFFWFFALLSGLGGGAYAWAYVIGADDLLAIQVWDEEKLSGEFRVKQDGSIDYPLRPGFLVKGLTTSELEKKMTGFLAKDYLRRPRVAVSVKEYRSQKVFVLGAVQNSGVYYLKGPTRFLDLLMEAGGPTSSASNRAMLLKAGRLAEAVALAKPDAVSEAEDLEHRSIDLDALFKKGKIQENQMVDAGSLLYVVPQNAGKAGNEVVYVYGEVKAPGVYDYSDGMTAFNAVTKAGGPTQYAKLDKTRVIRTEKDKSRNFRLKLSKVANAGQTQFDLSLKPGDTVVISGGLF